MGLSSCLISHLSLFFLLVNLNTLLDIVLKLSALLGRELVKFELEDFTSVCGKAILHEANNAPLLLLCEVADTVLERVLLFDVHRLVRDGALLRRHYDVLYLTLGTLVPRRCVHVERWLLLSRLLGWRRLLGLWLLR